MNILFIGDVVGKAGRDGVKKCLPKYRDLLNTDLIIANVENSAGGAGITEKVYYELKETGIDVMTSGNHIWDQKDVFNFIDSKPDLLRPANYPDSATPGKGYYLCEFKNKKVAVLNLMGQVFMNDVNCPFQCADILLEKISAYNPNVIVVDFHAEATSEKQAMGWYLNGKVAAVIGTHTHVQTNDQRILPEKTAYITDVGMTGNYNSILGVDVEGPMKRFVTKMPCSFKISKGKVLFNAVLLKIGQDGGYAISMETIREVL